MTDETHLKSGDTVTNACSRQDSFRNDVRYQALVREGYCPECGHNSLQQPQKTAYMIRCTECGAEYSKEDFLYGPLSVR